MSIRRAGFLMSQKCWQQKHKNTQHKNDWEAAWYPNFMKKPQNTRHIISYGREIISWGEQHLFAAEAAGELDPSLQEAGAGQANWDMSGHCTSWACPHRAEGRLTSKGCMSPVKQQISSSPLCCKETSDELTQSTAAHVTLVIYYLEQFLPSTALRIGTGRLIGF